MCSGSDSSFEVFDSLRDCLPVTRRHPPPIKANRGSGSRERYLGASFGFYFPCVFFGYVFKERLKDSSVKVSCFLTYSLSMRCSRFDCYCTLGFTARHSVLCVCVWISRICERSLLAGELYSLGQVLPMRFGWFKLVGDLWINLFFSSEEHFFLALMFVFNVSIIPEKCL